jgi:hypothetical protein
MRRLATLVTTLALTMSGLVFSPTHAAVPSSGDYVCTTGLIKTTETTNLYTITTTSSVTSVSFHISGKCTGAVVIPDGVTHIGSSAFYNATSLTSITLPDTVINIGDSAFYNATSLTSITLPANVNAIGTSAFRGATSLTSITLPVGVVSITPNVFYGATSLTSITILGNVTGIFSSAFYGATSLTSITLPATVTSIGKQAFYNATSLTSITIPSGVTSIGIEAFKGASSLTSITIPASVITIGANAFDKATSLTSFTVTEPNGNFTSFVGVLFNNDLTTLIYYPAKASDTSYTIPATVTSVGAYAFYGATSLTSITIPATVTIIGTAAFYNATSLTSITLPANLTSIGLEAFTGATSMTSFTFAAENANYKADAGVLFNKASSTLINYPAKASDTSYTIPATVTSIGTAAFYNATSLTSMTIPATVTGIGGSAFAKATSLTSFTVDPSNANYTSTAGVLFNKASTTLINYPAKASDTSYTIPATVTSVGAYAFYEATLLTNVYFLGNAPGVTTISFLNVASGTKAYIKSGATGFIVSGTPALWNGLIVEVVADTPPAVIDTAPAVIDTPPAFNTPATSVDTPAQAVDTVLVAPTVSAKKKYSGKALAKRVGVTIVSSKATVSISVAKRSRNICARSYSKLKTLKAGKCVVTFTVQEPKPKKGKKPKATKTVKTLIVQ